jgi:hypothetical protein
MRAAIGAGNSTKQPRRAIFSEHRQHSNSVQKELLTKRRGESRDQYNTRIGLCL